MVTVEESSDFRDAARECGPIWVGMCGLGVGFGVLVTSQGLPWWLAPVISGVLFAGSVEFLLVGMLVASAPVVAVVTTTLLVNGRHLFYGLTFPLEHVQGRAARAYSVFALCDEAYAVLSVRDPRELTSARILWTQAGMHVGWAGGSLLGGVLGGSLLGEVPGLDFILTALFLVLSMDAFRTRPDPVTLAIAVAAAGVAVLLVPQAMILVALVVFTAALVVRHRMQGRPDA
ncbi:MAG: AzlC family ABC transporter permease [Aeromicrobium sp.]|uniref:AzlC family ABC transporter permease n=1 Tax=Aeromicrobium sp. TaxID=1871063 RepID=UPI002628F319|nr:AzlC family ABC transporter permease [Aeromicrobium sp.]MDF1704898.1 AzlC family ABC transporter permease [Aeromicrobium sp.]